MRIIAGQHKSRKLQALEGQSTRPTMDHVKEACFARLGPWIEGKAVLDLFAGSGNIGLEALSRGADRAVFVEGSLKAFHVLKANVELLNYQDQVEVYRMDAFDACRYLRKQNRTFDFIYLDPPYQKIDMVKLMHGILSLTHAKTKLVYECLVDDEPLAFDGFELVHSARYGRIRLDTYRRQ
jgi:16S rRNA (guanine966-N2)-methyltransferase